MKTTKKPKQDNKPLKIKRKIGYDTDDDAREIEKARAKILRLNIDDQSPNDGSAPNNVSSASINEVNKGSGQPLDEQSANRDKGIDLLMAIN